MSPFTSYGAEKKLLVTFFWNAHVSTRKKFTCIHSFYRHTPPPALFFKSPRPCLSNNVIISRLKARLLIIVLYVALCLVSDSIHLCGHHFITFLVTEVKKINGNQIPLLTGRLKGQRLQFAVHHLSFKTFHFFYYLSLLLFIAPSSEHFLTPSVAFCRAKHFCRITEQVREEPTVAISWQVLWTLPKESGCKDNFVIWAVPGYCIYCCVCSLLVVLIKITVIHSSNVPWTMEGVLQCCSKNKSSQGGASGWKTWYGTA